jgi:hypothetical protein
MRARCVEDWREDWGRLWIGVRDVLCVIPYSTPLTSFIACHSPVSNRYSRYTGRTETDH